MLIEIFISVLFFAYYLFSIFFLVSYMEEPIHKNPIIMRLLWTILIIIFAPIVVPIVLGIFVSQKIDELL